ncbi:MAG: CHRD domain-containing protein [Betaproteobacteria bacterium]
MINFKKSKLAAAIFALGTFGSGLAFAADVKVKLSGANEVPPVTTSSSGEGTISIADDGAVSGSVMTKGIQGTAAHIHIAAAGKNGPVIVPFTKDGDTYKAPAGAKLNADQIKAFKAGELYVNVHSAANPGGELRGQLK